ncbi:hypothetical protein EDC02_4620 [Micromonospora sp. Llam0]|nr:hypothetical protein EDC02_4620 [Micromonospora sp. Llam0]
MSARQRVAGVSVPPDTHDWVRLDAIRELATGLRS